MLGCADSHKRIYFMTPSPYERIFFPEFSLSEPIREGENKKREKKEYGG